VLIAAPGLFAEDNQPVAYVSHRFFDNGGIRGTFFTYQKDTDVSSVLLVENGTNAIIESYQPDAEDLVAIYLSYDTKTGAYEVDKYTTLFAMKDADDPSPEAPGATDRVPYFQLNDDRVRLRASPTTSAAVLQTLPKSALFKSVDRTDARETIGGVTERWYKILLRGSATQGWVFGGFILKE